MQTVDKILESKMKIRFHDCDPFNHLNNSRYIDYFMTARGDQLADHYNFDIYKLAREEAVGWVSAQTQISYFQPALLMEEVVIRTQLFSFTPKSLQVEGTMWSTDQKTIKALMWAKLVHFDLRSKQSCAHSEKLMQFFGDIVSPIGDSDFEQRVQSMKQGR